LHKTKIRFLERKIGEGTQEVLIFSLVEGLRIIHGYLFLSMNYTSGIFVGLQDDCLVRAF